MKRFSIKDRLEITKIIDGSGRFKAELGGSVLGVGKSKAEAIENAEKEIADRLTRGQQPALGLHDGFLVLSQVESSSAAWYGIVELSELKNGPVRFAFTCLAPSKLVDAIESDIRQRKGE